MTATRLVVLGGTFDPVHIGHLSLLRGARKVLDAALGVVVVEDGHRHRAVPVAPVQDRRHLVQLAIDGDGTLSEASQMGIDAGLVGAVDHLRDLGHEVHVVFGSDSARHLDRWNGRELLHGAELWVVPRQGDADGGCPGVGRLPVLVPAVSATQIRLAAAARRRSQAAVPPPCRARVDCLYGASNGVDDRATAYESA